MVMQIDAGPELEAMVAAVQRATERVAQFYQQHLNEGIEVASKGAEGPVTEADREVNAMLVAALSARFPDAVIVAEESAPDAAELAAQLSLASRVFYVDPLDGTREFVNGNPEFAVMVGLAIDGKAAAGVVGLPCEGKLLAGRVGQRAFSQDSQGERRFVGVTRCANFVDASMLVSRSHTPPLVEPLCRRLGVQKRIPCGSVGVKVARMVLAEADLYVHSGPGLKKWDTCGPEALLTAAGGRLSDLQGAPIDYAAPRLGVDGGIVASNGVLHVGVLSAVDWARAELKRVSGLNRVGG